MVGEATVGRRKLYHSNGALKVVSTIKQFYVLYSSLKRHFTVLLELNME
jgi:hypothetical protein